MTTTLDAGTTYSVTRTFTAQLVQAFVALSGDAGRHHVATSSSERVLVHGPLVASLATELGGRLNYLARTMELDFRRPVYAGDTVTCTMRIDGSTIDEKGTHLRFSGDAVNQDGVVVMRMTSSGLVRHAGEPPS